MQLYFNTYDLIVFPICEYRLLYLAITFIYFELYAYFCAELDIVGFFENEAYDASVDSQCPGCLGQTVVPLRLLCAIVESPRRHKHAPFVNIAFLRSRSIKRRQWKHKLDYHSEVFAHLATGCGIKAKDPSGLDSDRWIPHSRCCENPTRTQALALFSGILGISSDGMNSTTMCTYFLKVIKQFSMWRINTLIRHESHKNPRTIPSQHVIWETCRHGINI